MQRTNATTVAFCLNSNGTLLLHRCQCKVFIAVSWRLYGDEQGHALQMSLLVRAHRRVRHGSGAKEGLRQSYSGLNKLHPTTSSSVWIYMAVQKSSVLHPSVHTSSLRVCCGFLPSHASKLSSRKSQDLGGHHTLPPRLFSAACGDLPQLCHEGPWSQHRPCSRWRGSDPPVGETHISLLRKQGPLVKQVPIVQPYS